MKWRDGGMYGQMQREIVTEDGGHPIAMVRVKQYCAGEGTEPWLQGEVHFRLFLAAPEMLEALCSIRDTAECFLQPLPACTSRERWEVVRDRAVAAIAAVKGESDDLES